jgi:hypothetical protein
MWPRWVPALAGSVALVAALGFGTFGWFVNAFGIGSDCTDKYSCGSGSCTPCAIAHAWVWAGGIGEWVLVATAVAILVMAARLPHWRRAITIAAVAVTLFVVAWYAASTAMAERSY